MSLSVQATQDSMRESRTPRPSRALTSTKAQPESAQYTITGRVRAEQVFPRFSKNERHMTR